MKKLLVAVLFSVILLAFIVVPIGATSPFQQFIQYQVRTGTVVYDLDLNNSITKIGTVTVWSDATSLHVKYSLDSPWVMQNNHLAVASGATIALAQAKIPGPPGQFDKTPFPIGYWGGSNNYSTPYIVTTASFDSIPLSSFTDITDGWLVICAHTSVQHNDGSNAGTAWATGVGKLITPLPELPAIVLLSVGLAGLAAFIIIKKKKSLAKVS